MGIVKVFNLDVLISLWKVEVRHVVENRRRKETGRRLRAAVFVSVGRAVTVIEYSEDLWGKLFAGPSCQASLDFVCLPSVVSS
jgi:hypothetical protein